MNTMIRIENHQPVPLRKLNDVIGELVAAGKEEAVIYLDMVCWEGTIMQGLDGWYVWQMGGHWTDVDGQNEFWGDSIDYEVTEARTLQPGEKLHVTFEG